MIYFTVYYYYGGIAMRMSDYNPDLGFIRFSTPDLTETMLFYTELGFDVLGTDMEDDHQTIYLKLGHLVLAVDECTNAATENGGTVHYSIQVDDIQGAYDLICSRGLNSLNEEIRSGILMGKDARFFSVQGPAGEIILFLQF